jgi:hypothetical protein
MKLRFINKSNKTLKVKLLLNINDYRLSIINNSLALINGRNIYENTPCYTVKQDSIIYFPAWHSWESYIETSSPDKKVHIFIINNEVFMQNINDDSLKKVFLLKQYDLDLNDLEKMNWAIEYKE